MITEVWHIPEQYDARRDPLYPNDNSQSVEIWIGTYPTGPGQSVWICYQEFDKDGNLIPDPHSKVLVPDSPPNPLHYVQCNWRYNNADTNSYWSGKIGPFSENAQKIIYNIFARQGNKTITIPTPDFFEFRLAQLPYAEAPGAPGNAPVWSSGSKEGFGTALNDKSKVWFSHSEGTINEIYFPYLDKPNIKDFQFLVLDKNGKFNNPKAMDSNVQYLNTVQDFGGDTIPKCLAYRITNYDTSDSGQSRKRYELTMDVLSDPSDDGNSILIGMKYNPLLPEAKDFRIFALLNPHINDSGMGDSGKFVYYKNHLMFLSWDNGIYCAMDINRSISNYSCGFCGVNDGWTDLQGHKDLTYNFTHAYGGNIAAIMEINLPKDNPAALVTLSFGQSEEEALSRAYTAVSKDICSVASQFIAQWKGYVKNLEDSGDLKAITSGQDEETTKLAYVSTMVLKAMEDKSYKGAIIASPSIPWGDCTGDSNTGGYHLVWGRDLYNMATAAMAVGDYDTTLSIIRYFDNVLQESNGSMPQNTWVNGAHYWGSEQLDETAYPIILAWRLKKLNKLANLGGMDIYKTLVEPAADFLAAYEDSWTQDRWEEVTGRSPFTVATVVSALIVAARWADERKDNKRRDTWQNKAVDFAVSDLKDCYTAEMGQEYYARVFNPWGNEKDKVCKDVIDGGFLELARLGVKNPNNGKIINSLRAVDQCIRQDINGNSYFLRYGRIDKQDKLGMDVYGEDDEGRCWSGDHPGRGRYWPLLSGERGHYELIKTGPGEAKKYLKAMLAAANTGYMLPEQIWGSPSIKKEEHGNSLIMGQGTKSATPLGWTHGEFLKLLRSIHDGTVFDMLSEVSEFCNQEHDYKNQQVNIYNS
jgi:glucoamylase